MEEKKILKILFIEDLPTDTELAVRELQKSGLKFSYSRVETRNAYLESLKNINPDLIISDYMLPEFNGMDALKLMFECDIYIPFIILTGSMNEDIAVSCIKSGATDYVIKEHITRLPFAIKEAMEQKFLKRKKEIAEIALRKSEKKYRSIFENIQDVYYEASLDGAILEISPSIKIMTRGQYKREDLIGKSLLDIYNDPKEKDNLFAILKKNERVFDFEVILKNLDGSLIPCSLSSKIQFDEMGRPDKIVGTMRDITERKQVEEMLLNRARDLALTREAIISSMAILAEFRDPETGAHIQRTKLYVKLIFEKLGELAPYSPDTIELIWHSASLHDIGKVGIPDSILFKPFKLTDEEFEQIKTHTLIGSDVIKRAEKILGEISFLSFAREITEYHHEKWNGTGYPHGLKGNEIPLSARIMALADVYDALVSRRPYKDPLPHQEAIEIIKNDAGIYFDPLLVQIFIDNNMEFYKIAENYKEE